MASPRVEFVDMTDFHAMGQVQAQLALPTFI
jgi:hypothetical protein